MKLNRNPKKPRSNPTTCSKLVLEEVIGLTVKNCNGLASSLNSKCVYVAGCVVVIYDVDSGTQSHVMVSNRSPKPLSCVAVSQDGSFIAAGESGQQSAVLVWDSATLASVSELKGHQYGVACIAFSPDGKHLVSVGFPLDGYLRLWDWRSGILVTKLKACSSFSAVASISISQDANFILTAGKRHLKIWRIGLPIKSRIKTEAVSLTNGKSVKLGNHKGCTFIAITPTKTKRNAVDGKGGEPLSLYALTDAGVLCFLHGGLTITHSVDLKVEKGFGLSASEAFVACACNNGTVKLYTTASLEYAGSLQYNEVIQCNMTVGKDCQSKVSEAGIQPLPTFPDAIACQFSSLEKLVVVYGDHSLYIWNIHGKYKATKCCVLVSHSSCIWDIKNLSCENMHEPSLACVARGCTGGVSFATCSADGTIRFWDLALQRVSSENISTLTTDHYHLVTEPFGTCLVSAGTFERESVVSGLTQGYRSMAVSSDGKHLAAGDSDGNIHIYNLYTSDYTYIKDVHDAEILSLNFSLPVEKSILSTKDPESYYLLTSGGRDRMMHLFDVNRNFDLIASADDHSAAVTSVKLTGNGRKILSCGADRSLIFHDVSGRGADYSISRCHHQKSSHGTIYDMAVDPTTEIAVTVGQDKKINIFNIASGQVIRSFKLDGDFGDPVKVTLDPSCSFVVCSYSNRCVCIYDFISGDMVAQAMGHGEVINGIIFLPDCKHVVSVGGDSCIFVWKVPTPLTLKMLQRIKESSCPLSPSTFAQHATVNQIKVYDRDDLRLQIKPKDSVSCERKCLQDTSTFKFSISRLPEWAKSKVTSPLVTVDSELCKLVGREDLAPSMLSGGENSAVHLALQTPSNLDLNSSKKFPRRMSRSSSDTSNSKGSSTPKGACRSFALDKRWFTIHTVCFDLLNSPEVCGVKEGMVSTSSNLSQDPALEAIDISAMTLQNTYPSLKNSSVSHISSNDDLDVRPGACPDDQPGLNNSCASCNNISQRGINDACLLGKQVANENSVQVQPFTSVDLEIGQRYLNIGDTSANSKAEGKNSTAMKSYSARFVVRRDLLQGRKILQDSPDLGKTMYSDKETSLNNLADFSLPEQEELQRRTRISTQNLASPHHIVSQSNSISSSVKSMKAEVMEVKGQEVRNFIEDEKQKTLDACKEALQILDASTRTALQVFSKLGGIVSKQEAPEGPEAQLFAEAAEMLPSIAKNVHEIAKMAACFPNSCHENKTDVSGFEPLLGKFAESLSRRVIEILKDNCSSL